VDDPDEEEDVRPLEYLPALAHEHLLQGIVSVLLPLRPLQLLLLPAVYLLSQLQQTDQRLLQRSLRLPRGLLQRLQAPQVEFQPDYALQLLVDLYCLLGQRDGYLLVLGRQTLLLRLLLLPLLASLLEGVDVALEVEDAVVQLLHQVVYLYAVLLLQQLQSGQKLLGYLDCLAGIVRVHEQHQPFPENWLLAEVYLAIQHALEVLH
jgi:hypothetical protein